MLKSVLIIDRASAAALALPNAEAAIMAALVMMERGIIIDSMVVTNFIRAIPIDVSQDMLETYNRVNAALAKIDSLT